MPGIFKNHLNDFMALFFPQLCAGCGNNLLKSEQELCIHCIYNLPVTDFHKDPDNKLSRQFWGRLPIKQASSYVYFRKGGRVRNIMHQLKYDRNSAAGFRMGQLYASILNNTEEWLKPEVIVPVPLHPAKLRKRGYNQSEVIAGGMASILGIPVWPDVLQRREDTASQTRKSRFARYENLKAAFTCPDGSRIINKHILLIDDVMTTGATLEACGLLLLENRGTEISIATIAYTE